MAIARISGPLLASNLVRTQSDLKFETDLLHIGSSNTRIGVRTDAPTDLLQINGQVKIIDPLIIVLIGSTSLRAILGLKSKITELRGTWHNWNGIYLMPIFHPAYLLRNPSRSVGKPYELTCIDLIEVKKKLTELNSYAKNSNPFFKANTTS